MQVSINNKWIYISYAKKPLTIAPYENLNTKKVWLETEQITREISSPLYIAPYQFITYS